MFPLTNAPFQPTVAYRNDISTRSDKVSALSDDISTWGDGIFTCSVAVTFLPLMITFVHVTMSVLTFGDEISACSDDI